MNGKWWLVDPAGHLYFAQGLNCGWDLTPTAIQYREEYFEKLPPKDGPTKRFWSQIKNVAYRNDKRNPETFVAASKYCDVVTVNVYDFQASVTLPAAAEDRPLWVTEFHFGCYDTGYFYASLVPVANQKVRADSYLAYLRSAIDNPNYVGANWFCWRDQPITGVIGESANSSCGVVSVTDVPYRELTDAMKTIAGEMYRRRYNEAK